MRVQGADFLVDPMDMFLKGIAMGFCIAAPVGPIGLLCIRRSIIDGRSQGFVSGLGAATADAVYGFIAALSLTAVTEFLLEYRTHLHLFGGAFLVYLGIKQIRAQPATSASGAVHAKGLASAYASTLLLTLANPATIIAFVGIFAGLGLESAGYATRWVAAEIVLGVFLGSATWWLMLSAGAHWLGNKVGAQRLHLINLASGSLITALGLWQFAIVAR